IIAILAGALALGIGAYWGNRALAQNGQAPAQTPIYSRIAVINLGQVIKNYEKYKAFEADIRQQAKTLQDGLDKRNQGALQAQKEMEQPTTTAERRMQIEKELRQTKFEMQSSVEEAKQKLAKIEFEEMVKTYKEV